VLCVCGRGLGYIKHVSAFSKDPKLVWVCLNHWCGSDKHKHLPTYNASHVTGPSCCVMLCHAVLCRQMLMAAKVPSCAALALDAVYKQGMCVVIGLQSTGEANTTAVSAPLQPTLYPAQA
jgi:hypothetical protein